MEGIRMIFLFFKGPKVWIKQVQIFSTLLCFTSIEWTSVPNSVKTLRGTDWDHLLSDHVPTHVNNCSILTTAFV